jgi:enoyl-[acyl-carrier protein] reductase III
MTILITGGTKGIGLAIAERLSRPGEKLALAYLADDAAAAEAKQRCEAKGATVTVLRSDVSTVEGCEAVMAEIKRSGGSVRHIVHSAAMVYPTNMLDADLTKFTRAMQANGLSLFYLVRTAMPMLTRGRPARARRGRVMPRSASAKRSPKPASVISCRSWHRSAFASTRRRRASCTRPRSPR